MNRLYFMLVIILGLCLMGQWSWATKTYVTDSCEINLYDGPSTKNKVIAVVPSGESVEVFLSQEDWSFVRLLERGENNKEGFILSRYLITPLPWERQARSLKEENTRLKERLAHMENKWSEAVRREQEVTEKLQDHTEALHRFQKEYESLRQEAADYLELKAAHTGILSAMEPIQKRIQGLSEENERLKSSDSIKFFIVEVLVLLTGLIIGLAMGREQKKQRSLYY